MVRYPRPGNVVVNISMIPRDCEISVGFWDVLAREHAYTIERDSFCSFRMLDGFDYIGLKSVFGVMLLTKWTRIFIASSRSL
jgi:hypothetical protein